MASTAQASVETSRNLLVTQIAIRPLLHRTDDHLECGLCGNQLTRLVVPVLRHELVVLICSTCGWHTRLIDDNLATQDDLLTASDDWTPRQHSADAVTWYRSGAAHQCRSPG